MGAVDNGDQNSSTLRSTLGLLSEGQPVDDGDNRLIVMLRSMIGCAQPGIVLWMATGQGMESTAADRPVSLGRTYRLGGDKGRLVPGTRRVQTAHSPVRRLLHPVAHKVVSNAYPRLRLHHARANVA